MGSRGPVAKPEDERQGRNDPVQVAVREKGLPIPVPPPELKPIVIELWNRLWSSPVGRVWDPDMDASMVERYARNLHHWHNAQDDLAILEDVISHGSQGQPVLHPLTQYIVQLEQRLGQMEDKLGLSPMSRARLGLTIAEGELTAAQLNEMVRSKQRKD